MVQATLFVGLEGLLVRCSFTKNGLVTGRQNQLTRVAFSVQFRGSSGFKAWAGLTSKIRGRKRTTDDAQNCDVFQNKLIDHFRVEQRPLSHALACATCFTWKNVQENLSFVASLLGLWLRSANSSFNPLVNTFPRKNFAPPSSCIG